MAQAKRQYRPKNRCKAKKADGSRCNGAGVEAKGFLCNLHFSIKHGEPLPQQSRKKRIKDTSVPVMLRKFGMPAKDVTQLRLAFPDLDSTIVGEASVDAIVHVLVKVLSLKLIAAPKSETATVLMSLASWVKAQEGGLSVSPNEDRGDVSSADNGDWEAPPGL